MSTTTTAADFCEHLQLVHGPELLSTKEKDLKTQEALRLTVLLHAAVGSFSFAAIQ